jgi:tRNA dimethylallyltransferase
MSVDAVLIAGPTAAGKSAAALALAERIGAVIVNADSMQVYSELPILTGQPSKPDQARIPHRLYGHVSVTERYSAGRYQWDAAAALAEVRDKDRTAIFVGGTGLYFNVLTRGLSPMPQVPAETRASVRARFDAIGRERFYAELLQRDPAAAQLRPSDTQRVLRAADVLQATGRPISEWQRVAGKPVLNGLKLARFVISPERDVLYDRIDRRFEQMIAEGALEEARSLLHLDPSLPAARSLGVPELLQFLRGEISLAEATAAAQMATRRFAKRQLTWFRRYMADWMWIGESDLRNIMASITREL